MEPLAELYSRTGLRTTALAAEPLALLLENSETHFGMRLCGSCHENSWEQRLTLEEVTWFRAERKSFQYCSLPDASLIKEEGGYAVRALARGRAFPNRSRVPYKLIFMAPDIYTILLAELKVGHGSVLFSFAQRHFGRLPGFSACDNRLTSPDDYASVKDRPDSQMLAS